MLLGTLGEHIGNMGNMANTNWELVGKPIGNKKNILLNVHLLTLMVVDALELFKSYILFPILLITLLFFFLFVY